MVDPIITEDNLERQAAAFLHVEILPGTDVVRDVGEFHFTHSKHGIVLHPHPSEDPKDPLNWSKAWKFTAIISQVLFVFISVESALSMAPMFPLMGADLLLDTQQLSLLTGVSVIALGYANFAIVPFSNIFGRRAASLILSTLTILTCIWEALATSYSSLLGARVLNGICTATSESIMMQAVADLFFLHERGAWTGVYFTSYFLGLFLGPVISGNIAEKHGWRSFFWLSTGLAGFQSIMLFFTYPETKFYRQRIQSQNISQGPISQDLANYETEVHKSSATELDNIPTSGVQDSYILQGPATQLGKGHPSKQQFLPIQKPDARWKSFIARDILTPLRAFTYPIIFWAGMCVAGPANMLLFWNLTESAVLAAPPYNWNGSQVGYANFAFVVGGVVGLLTAGPFSDWVSTRSAKRNNGIREAEMRLPALIPFAATTIVGITVGGIAYDRQWPWQAILVVGYGLTGLCVTTIPTIAVAYAVDCYKPVTGEIMVVATVIKNTCGFGMSYWVNDLAAREGYIAPAMVMLALTIGPVLLGIPLYFFGKTLRRMTRESKLHEMEL